MNGQDSDDDLIYVNGINASTGKYIEDPLSPTDATALALGEEPSPDEDELADRAVPQQAYLPALNIDPKDLAQSGWAVILHGDADPGIRDALAELLDHRRAGAGDLYREYAGTDGYLPGDTWESFRMRPCHLVSNGLARPLQMPYYVLIVGDPEAIPYSFQYSLDVQRAVGRISFRTLDEYASYAHSVVAAESEATSPLLPRRAVVFAPVNRDDRQTRHSHAELAAPVAAALARELVGKWQIDRFIGDEAHKARLARILGGPDTPALLFVASHGAGLNRTDSRWPLHQGALVTSDWPGPVEWEGPLSERDHYFSSDDLGTSARLWGLIAVFFACYGAGVPRLSDFIHRRAHDPRERLDISETAFLASLPLKMLSHHRGGPWP